MSEPKQEFTELEKIYQRTIEKLTGQVADLTANLNITQAQLEIAEENNKEREDNKNAKK